MSSKSQHLVSEAAALAEQVSSLYSYAMVLTRDPAQAEDLVQETYVRALPALESLRAESKVKSWLFTILRNIWLNQLRKYRVVSSAVGLDMDERMANIPEESSKDSHALYVSKVERDQVRNAIQQLPTDLREIILLREYEELSYQEIAEVLACPGGTVMSRLSRARLRLRTLLSATPEPQVKTRKK